MSEFSRECVSCGKIHDSGFQDTRTGEMIKRLDKCHYCFMKTAFHILPITEQVTLAKDFDELFDKTTNSLKKT